MILHPKMRESRSPPGLPSHAGSPAPGRCPRAGPPAGRAHAPVALGGSRAFDFRAVRSDRPTPAGWSSPVARQAHNLKVTGSNPVPATPTFIRLVPNFHLGQANPHTPSVTSDAAHAARVLTVVWLDDISGECAGLDHACDGVSTNCKAVTASARLTTSQCEQSLTAPFCRP